MAKHLWSMEKFVVIPQLQFNKTMSVFLQIYILIVMS